MIVYLDTSVALRKLLRRPDAIPSWGGWERACASALLEVEAARAFLRLRDEGALDDLRLTRAFEDLRALLDGLDLVELSEPVLRKACQPFPTRLKTLDALHLASAILWAESVRQPVVFLTHDARLEIAARAVGLKTALR